jgi:hypothetical protein
MGWGGMDCIGLAQGTEHWRAFCEHSNEHSGSTECWEILE